MKFLQMVKEKQAAYDNIFEPLQEIIDVLTTYNAVSYTHLTLPTTPYV